MRWRKTSLSRVDIVHRRRPRRAEACMQGGTSPRRWLEQEALATAQERSRSHRPRAPVPPGPERRQRSWPKGKSRSSRGHPRKLARKGRGPTRFASPSSRARRRWPWPAAGGWERASLTALEPRPVELTSAESRCPEGYAQGVRARRYHNRGRLPVRPPFITVSAVGRRHCPAWLEGPQRRGQLVGKVTGRSCDAI